jgi:predicted kinase
MTNKLYIFCGIPFSGKSTLSKEIARLKDYKRIDLDEVKFELYGANVKDTNLEQKDWDITYQAMYQHIEAALKAGESVIHDTGNFTRYERNLVREIAERLGVEAITVFVNTPEPIARERLLANRMTNTRFNVTDQEFQEAIDEMEAPHSTEQHIVYEHDTPTGDWVDKHFS